MRALGIGATTCALMQLMHQVMRFLLAEPHHAANVDATQLSEHTKYQIDTLVHQDESYFYFIFTDVDSPSTIYSSDYHSHCIRKVNLADGKLNAGLQAFSYACTPLCHCRPRTKDIACWRWVHTNTVHAAVGNVFP
jgi:hypothetical protein